MAKRRNFSAAFKARVALEALRGDQTLAALAARHKVHPNLITKWQRQAGEGLAGIFLGPAGRRGFITKLAHSGISSKVIMELAGHKHLSTTQRYIYVNDQMKQAAVEVV